MIQTQRSPRVMKASLPTSAKSYKLKYGIGGGAFADVFRATCEINKQKLQVAVKIISIKRLAREDKNSSVHVDVTELSREAHLMSTLRHPNILKLYTTFVNKQQIWLITHLCKNGSCADIIKNCKDFNKGFQDDKILASILQDVLQGIDYLHQNNFVHRDIKGSNILLTACGRALIADFGVSTCLVKGGLRRATRRKMAGTPCYMAPELLSKERYTYKIDIWSLGITAIELAFGKPPNYHLDNCRIAINTIENDAPKVDDQGINKLSQEFKKFVSKCLVKDFNKRWKSKDLLKHNFIKKYTVGTGHDYIKQNVLNKSYKCIKNKHIKNDTLNSYIKQNKKHSTDLCYTVALNPSKSNADRDDPIKMERCFSFGSTICEKSQRLLKQISDDY